MPSRIRQKGRQGAAKCAAGSGHADDGDDALRDDLWPGIDAARAAGKIAITAKCKRGHPAYVILQGRYKAQFGSLYRGEHETFGRECDRTRNNATSKRTIEANVRACIAAIEKRGERVTHASIAAQWPLSFPDVGQQPEATIRRMLTLIRKPR